MCINIRMSTLYAGLSRTNKRSPHLDIFLISYRMLKVRKETLRQMQRKDRSSSKNDNYTDNHPLMATMQAKRLSIIVFKVQRECNHQSRIVSIARLSFQNESKIKRLFNEQILREFTTNRPSPKEFFMNKKHDPINVLHS